MSTDIIKIDPKEFGLEETKAAQIAAQFQPMLDKMIELESEFNEVVALPIDDAATAVRAKELRLKYVKVRTGTADIHKEQKAFYLAGGRFVDGWKNAQLFAANGIEAKLKEIEDYRSNQEKLRVEKLHSERVEFLKQFDFELNTGIDFGVMPDTVWGNFWQGIKLGFEAKKEAERVAEENRIERERIEAEEREKHRIENERLKAEAEAKAELRRKRSKEIAPYLKFIQDVEAVLEMSDDEFNETMLSCHNAAIKQAEIDAEKKRIEEEKAESERIERERQQEELQKANEEKERLQREIEQKQAEEQRKESERIEALENELRKGDAAKLEDLVNDLFSIQSKYEFKSKKNKQIYSEVAALIGKIITHIELKK